MISLLTQGDGIAREFSKLVAKKAPISKTAKQEEGEETPSLLEQLSDGEIQPHSASVGGKASGDDGFSEAMEAAMDKLKDKMTFRDIPPTEQEEGEKKFDPKDFLTSDVSEEDGDMASDALDREIEAIASSKILNGLRKISSGLRKKNENFAADMVQATAISIARDMSKEANKVASTVNSLKKIAKDLANSGDTLAADVVMVTIHKITSK